MMEKNKVKEKEKRKDEIKTSNISINSSYYIGYA